MSARQFVASDETTSALARSVLATLPQSFASWSPDHGSPDVLIVAGASGWSTRAAASSTAKDGWTVVVDPEVEAVDDVGELAGKADGGRRVALLETYADNPAVEPFGGKIRFDVTMADMQHLTAGSLPNAMLAQVRLARAVGIKDLTLLSSVVTDASALMVVEAKLSSSSFRLTMLSARTAGVAPSQRMTLYGAEQTAHLELWCGRNARPGHAELVDAEGSLRLPTLYETAHRAALRALPAKSWEGGAHLRDLADDISLVNSIFRD